MNKKSEKIMKFFIYLIWIFMFIAGIVDSLTGNPYSIIMWYVDLVFLLFLYFKVKKIPLYYNLIFAVLVIINIFGEFAFGFYYILPNYDKFLHFLNALIYCGIPYYLAKPRIKNTKKLLLFSATAVMAYQCIWEIYEFLSDYFLGTTAQGVFMGTVRKGILFNVGAVQIMSPFTDTLFDMAFNLLGVMVFMIGYILYKRIKTAKSKNF